MPVPCDRLCRAKPGTLLRDGIGIPREEKEKIFDRGFGKNTGYGLFRIREILAIIGFTILENGTPGQGPVSSYAS